MKAVVASLMLVAGASLADPAPADDVTAHNREIVAKAANVDGVFAVQEDGTIRHLQSGLVCPARFPNVTLYDVQVYPPNTDKGSDVDCDYRRADDRGGADAKLTIFATRARPGQTLDDAFAGYRNEVLQTWKDVQSQGPALTIENKGGSPMPDIRSEEFVLPFNGRTYTSQLIVTIVNGWVLEIRATFTGLPNTIDMMKDAGTSTAVDEAGDRAMSPLAFIDAVASVGKPLPAPPPKD